METYYNETSTAIKNAEGLLNARDEKDQSEIRWTQMMDDPEREVGSEMNLLFLTTFHR